MQVLCYKNRRGRIIYSRCDAVSLSCSRHCSCYDDCNLGANNNALIYVLILLPEYTSGFQFGRADLVAAKSRANTVTEKLIVVNKQTTLTTNLKVFKFTSLPFHSGSIEKVASLHCFIYDGFTTFLVSCS